jgi:hypothetical protein
MNVRETLQRCFDNPNDCLGGIERNVEVKIVFLTLVELGWDPAASLGLNFQIPKELFGDATTTSLAIDMVARDDIGLCIAGEVKAHHKVKLEVHMCQILRYRDALRAPLAFLTNGSRWMLFRENGSKPFLDETFTSVDQMLEILAPHLRPGVVKGKQFNWRWGIGHKDKSIYPPLQDILSPAIESSAIGESIPVRSEIERTNDRRGLLDEVDRLAEAYPDKVYRDHTEDAAQLKRIGSNDAFVEIRFGPDNLKKYPKGYVTQRSNALAALPAPDDVRDRFAGYCGRELDDVPGFIKVTEELIGYL